MAWEPHVAEIVGRFVDASNATLLGTTGDGEEVVYKPTRGERPLWDFELETLAAREVLTYEVDVALGFGLVPETVLGDGPFGRGSIQRFVAHDVDFDAQPLARTGASSLWPIAVLDVVTNNADRKFGHVLSTAEGLKAIDHGLTFHPEEKLRTVLWVFAGKRLPEGSIEALERLLGACDGALGHRVANLLGRQELKALRSRTASLVAKGVHPDPPHDRPPIPWPPY